MSRACFKVVAAGPLVSFQDAGRPGHLRFGVPASGPMDRFAHAAANAMLGNALTATCIEVSLGGLVLECVEGPVSIAVAGGSFRIGVDGTVSEGWQVTTLEPGARLSVAGGGWGSWCYLAVAGEIAAPGWLDSTATHTLSGLGGGALAANAIVSVDNAATCPAREGTYDIPGIARPDGLARIVPGPQDAHFEAVSLTTLCSAQYRVTDAYNRMGMRLDGPPLRLADALSIPSEPILRGSIQVAGDGVPTILMADHQTTGGYPKIATLISSDIDQITQSRAGDVVSFEAIDAEQAVALARPHAKAIADALAELAAPRLTLDQRLLRSNLISGAVAD